MHRDIKPSNIMVCTKAGLGQVKLLDFGIVGTTHAHEPDRSITGSGRFVGTPLYMAPEQARRPDHVSPASDLYSLGVILFQMLAGRPPFDAPTVVDLVIQHTMEPVPKLGVAPELEHIVDWLLAKAPQQRPPSVDLLLEAFDALELEGAPAAPPSSEVFEPPDTLDLDLDPFDEATPFQEEPR